MKIKSVLLRTIVGILLGALSGLLFILAFPPFGIWPLIFFGWVPVLIAVHRIMPPKLSSLAPAVAIGVWLEGYFGPIFNGTGIYMVYLPPVMALFAFIFDINKRNFNQRTHYRWFVLDGVLSWAGIEMIRLFIPIAGTWGFISYPLYQQTWFIQPVSIFGIIGLGMLVMLINHVIAQALIHWMDRGWRREGKSGVPTRIVTRWAYGTAITLIIWMAISFILLLPKTDRIVTTAAIQPEISPIITGNRGETELLTQLYEDMIDETRRAAGQGAQFIVWPEGAVRADPQVNDYLHLVDLAKETKAYLVVGYVVNLEAGVFRNEATVISPEGEFLGVFGKDHPVLFGGETSPTRGTYPVYDTDLGILGTIICYDLDYTNTARKLAVQGAQLIGVPSNDWGGIADKHFTHVVFRAIENRAAMVKADGGYDSVIVDPYGQIQALASYPEGGGATLVADVSLWEGQRSIYSWLGDWTGWMGLAGILFFSVASSFLIKAAEKRDQEP